MTTFNCRAATWLSSQDESVAEPVLAFGLTLATAAVLGVRGAHAAD